MLLLRRLSSWWVSSLLRQLYMGVNLDRLVRTEGWSREAAAGGFLAREHGQGDREVERGSLGRGVGLGGRGGEGREGGGVVAGGRRALDGQGEASLREGQLFFRDSHVNQRGWTH